MSQSDAKPAGSPKPSRPIAGVLRTLLSLAILAAGVGVFLALGKADPPAQKEQTRQAPLVRVAAAQPHEEGISFAVDGVARAHADLNLAAESPGRVVTKAKNCRVGRTVSQGELLVQIDPRDYQLEVRRLEEELNQASVSVEELEVQVVNARRQVELAEENVELNRRELERVEGVNIPGVITDSDIDRTRRDVLTSRTTLQSQRDQLALLETSRRRVLSAIETTRTQLDAAKLALERCEIRAPIDGVVIDEHVEKGGYVQKGALIVTVRDTSRLDVLCSLRSEQLAWLWESRDTSQADLYGIPPTPVEVVYESGGQRYAWDGVLDRYDGAGLDPQTRMAPCLVHVDQPASVRVVEPNERGVQGTPPALMVGMFVEVNIQVTPRSKLLRLPSAAIKPGNRVWTVEDGRLVANEARVVQSRGEEVLVLADTGGLSAGDAIVVSPLSSPDEGTEVRLGDPS